MCSICNQSICPCSCPNADEPRHVFICSICGESICEGEHYYDIYGEQICEYCIDKFRKEAEYID